MFERILLPLDGSPVAEAILPQVRRLVSRHDAEVLVFTAAQPALDSGIPVDAARAYVRDVSGRLGAEGLRARALVRPGIPASAILDEAARWPATLIALASHGRSGLKRWTFGSVAEKILRASPVPVLAVRSFEGAPGAPPPFHTILVPIDGSEASLSILPGILALARPMDSRVVLLHVQESGEPRTEWTRHGDPVEKAQEVLRAACIPAEIRLRRGDAASEILEEAAASSADLVAMSTHGRSGPSRWLLGSVTERLLRSSRVPLFVSRRPA